MPMAAGVPMVVTPFMSDLPMNGRQVEKLALGRVREYQSVTPQMLRETAMSMMMDEKIRKNAMLMVQRGGSGTGKCRGCEDHRGMPGRFVICVFGKSGGCDRNDYFRNVTMFYVDFWCRLRYNGSGCILTVQYAVPMC